MASPTSYGIIIILLLAARLSFLNGAINVRLIPTNNLTIETAADELYIGLDGALNRRQQLQQEQKTQHNDAAELSEQLAQVERFLGKWLPRRIKFLVASQIQCSKPTSLLPTAYYRNMMVTFRADLSAIGGPFPFTGSRHRLIALQATSRFDLYNRLALNILSVMTASSTTDRYAHQLQDVEQARAELSSALTAIQATSNPGDSQMQAVVRGVQKLKKAVLKLPKIEEIWQSGGKKKKICPAVAQENVEVATILNQVVAIQTEQSQSQSKEEDSKEEKVPEEEMNTESIPEVSRQITEDSIHLAAMNATKKKRTTQKGRKPTCKEVCFYTMLGGILYIVLGAFIDTQLAMYWASRRRTSSDPDALLFNSTANATSVALLGSVTLPVAILGILLFLGVLISCGCWCIWRYYDLELSSSSKKKKMVPLGRSKMTGGSSFSTSSV